MRPFKSIRSLIFLVFLSILLTHCTPGSEPRVYSELEKNIIANAIADSCTVQFDSTNKTIQVSVINSHRRKNDGPLWPDISLVALEVMYSMEPEKFLLYDSIGVRFRQMKNDSFRESITQFHTRSILLADYIFRVTQPLIGGNGVVEKNGIRPLFDDTVKDEEILRLDSAIEAGPFFGDPTLKYGLNGFHISFSNELQKKFLFENLSVVTDKYFAEYQFIVDLETGLIIGVHELMPEDAEDTEAPVVYPR
jgi:hypothetical protein